MRETKIKALLQELIDNLDHLEIQNNEVSKASISWHVSHTTKIFASICKNAIQSNPTDFKRSFNKNRLKIKCIGFIPRGIGKSPKAYLNDEKPDKEELRSYLIKSKALFEDFCKVEPNQFFVHPIFGQLNKKDTLWFLKLHTEHHLKIIRDIRK